MNTELGRTLELVWDVIVAFITGTAARIDIGLHGARLKLWIFTDCTVPRWRLNFALWAAGRVPLRWRYFVALVTVVEFMRGDEVVPDIKAMEILDRAEKASR